jgi:hypothetical protein
MNRKLAEIYRLDSKAFIRLLRKNQENEVHTFYAIDQGEAEKKANGG